MIKRGFFLFLLLVVLSIPAIAQYSMKGFFLRPHLTGAAWSLDDLNEDGHSGGGAGLGLGYGISEMFAVFLALSGAIMENDAGSSYTLAHFDVGVQLNLSKAESAVKVVLDAASSARTARFEVSGTDIDFNGIGGTLGGGVMYFLSPSFALDGGVQIMFGSIDEISFGGEIADIPDFDATSARVNFGLAWFPGR